MYFGAQSDWAKANFNILLNNEKIETVDEYKNLGVLFDSKLRFRSQVSKIVKTSYYSLRNLYKSKHILNRQLRKQLCESLVLSHCNYCSFVYGPCLDAESKYRLQKIQNSCIILIFDLRLSDHVSSKLRVLNWLNIESRQKLHFACFLHKLLNSDKPKYLREKLIITSSRQNRRCNFAIPKHRTALFQRSFSYRAPKLINSEAFRSLREKSINGFKKHFKYYLLNETGN